MEYKKVWRVFNGEGYMIDDCSDGFSKPIEALQAAIDSGYDLQSMIDEGYTICLVLEDEYTWFEVLDETTVASTAALYGVRDPGREVIDNA